jgi:hypothetical protein
MDATSRDECTDVKLIMQGADKNCLENFDLKTLKNEASWGSRVRVDGRKGLAYLHPLSAELNPICHLLALLGAHPIFHISRIRVKEKSLVVCSGFNWLKIWSSGSIYHSGSKYMHNFLIISATIRLSTKTLFDAVITAPKDHVTSPRDTGFRYFSFGNFKDVDVLAQSSASNDVV